MELDQLLFKKVWKFVAQFKREKDDIHKDRIVHLKDIQNRLTVLARLLSGKPIEIFPAENYSSWKNNLFFLPEKYVQFDNYNDNYFYYIFRVFYLAQQLKFKITFPNKIPYSLDAALEYAYQQSEKTLDALALEYPPLIEQFNKLYPTNFRDEAQKKKIQDEWFGKVLLYDKDAVLEQADKKVNQWQKIEEDTKEAVELDAKTKDQIEVLEVDKEKQEQYTLTHNFEKVDTIDDFNGLWRDFEDDEDLEENQEALEELNMNQMVRVDAPSHSIYNADFFNSLGIKEYREIDTDEITKYLDEWDYKNRQYKKNFCQIYESPLKETSIEYTRQTFSKHQAVLVRLERRLIQFFNAYQKVRRQADGDEPDLDAITERFSDLYAGLTPSENIFISKRKKAKDIAILILTDISLSTDGFVEGQRIADVEKQSLLLFGEILSKQGTAFQLDVFSSRTRNHCEYHTIKKFDDNWDIVKHRIGALTPKGYTRIGAAIRNAHELLKKNTARTKWLLLLTDGKPNDYDRYEGKYGMEDVKQAVREVRKNDIHISALAIDSNAKFYLPQMLGNGGFQLVHHPNHLPDALTEFYMELMK